MFESLLRNLLRPNRCATAGAALILLATGCDLATEPLSAGNIVGEYELVLANGFLVPHDPFMSGALTIQADSSYRLFLNDAVSQSGYWTAKGTSFTATATSGD